MKVFVESLREVWYSTTQDKSSELNIGFPRFPRLNTKQGDVGKRKEVQSKFIRQLLTTVFQQRTRVFLVMRKKKVAVLLIKKFLSKISSKTKQI